MVFRQPLGLADSVQAPDSQEIGQAQPDRSLVAPEIDLEAFDSLAKAGKAVRTSPGKTLSRTTCECPGGSHNMHKSRARTLHSCKDRAGRTSHHRTTNNPASVRDFHVYSDESRQGLKANLTIYRQVRKGNCQETHQQPQGFRVQGFGVYRVSSSGNRCFGLFLRNSGILSCASGSDTT